MATRSGRRPPGPVLYWLATLLVVIVGIMIAVGLVRLFRSPGDTLDQRERMGVKTNAQFARRRDLRPLLATTPPSDRVLFGKLGRKFVVAEPRRTPPADPDATSATAVAASPPSGHHAPARARWPSR